LAAFALSQSSLDAFSSVSRADTSTSHGQGDYNTKKGRKKTSAITGSYKNKYIEVKKKEPQAQDTYLERHQQSPES
jgi:hypothetical protein